MSLRTVLFDLDGTLADTAPDVAYALNEVLKEQHQSPLPFEQIRPVVSEGALALVQLGFGFAPEDPRSADLHGRLLEVYRANLTLGTRLFPGMEELLEAIEGRGMNWGVVTNKPARLTEPLMEGLGLAHRAVTIVSGDTLPQRKPHPAPMLLACREAGVEPAHCVFIGDAERDVEAGRNAGMSTLIALFGYLSHHDRPHTWGADAMVQHPGDVLHWLEHRDLQRHPA